MKVRHAALALVALGAGVRVVSSMFGDDEADEQVSMGSHNNASSSSSSNASEEEPTQAAVDVGDEAAQVVHAENLQVENMLNARAPIQRMRDIECTNRECSVCLETMGDGAHVRVTPCNHVLHSSCLEKWVYYTVEKNFRRPYCPNCLADLGIDVPEQAPASPSRSRSVLRFILNEEFAHIPQQLIAEDAYVRFMVQRALENRHAARAARALSARLPGRSARMRRSSNQAEPTAVGAQQNGTDEIQHADAGASSSSLVVGTGFEAK